MKVVACIRCVETGEERLYNDRMDWPDTYGWPHPVFMYQEGNYSCDCNRELFFERVGGVELDCDDDSTRCGEVRYRVPWVEVDGVRHAVDAE